MRPVSRGSALQRYVSLAVILAFIGAGIWWRGSGEPTVLGLIIVGVAAAALVVAVTFTLAIRATVGERRLGQRSE